MSVLLYGALEAGSASLIHYDLSHRVVSLHIRIVSCQY
jgi:hypothetical protein